MIEIIATLVGLGIAALVITVIVGTLVLLGFVLKIVLFPLSLLFSLVKWVLVLVIVPVILFVVVPVVLGSLLFLIVPAVVIGALVLALGHLVFAI